MFKCQEDLNSSPRMDVRNVRSWKICSMVSVRVHVLYRNNWQRIWIKVVWSSQNLIPTFLSTRKSHVLYTLAILYFGLGKKTKSITWKCIYKSWVLICIRGRRRRVLMSDFGARKKNSIYWDEKNWIDSACSWSCRIGRWYGEGKIYTFRVEAFSQVCRCPSGMFSYSSVVSILLYLSSHTHPYIAFSVNSCAQYMFITKRYHELAFKMLAQY